MTGQRWVTFERNWSGRGTVIEGGYVDFDDPLRAFNIDEIDGTIIAIPDRLNRLTLVVCDMRSGQQLWSLDGLYVRSRTSHSRSNVHVCLFPDWHSAIL